MKLGEVVSHRTGRRITNQGYDQPEKNQSGQTQARWDIEVKYGSTC